MRNLEALPILCGHGGLNASRSPSMIRDIDLISLESLTFEHDTWQKDGGASKFSNTQITDAPSVLAMHDFHTPAGAQELVVATSDGKLLVLGVGGISKTVYTGGGTDKHTLLVEGYDGAQKVLYYYNGNVGPRVYAGGTDTTALLDEQGAVTADAGTNEFTKASHGLANGTPVQLRNSGGALPAGIASDTEYYVINTAANTFKLSTTVGGSEINITDAGTGTHTLYKATRADDWVAGKPAWAFQHSLGRMFAGGNTNRPDGVYVTPINEHSAFLHADALFFQVYPGEGERIVGGVSWRNKAYIFKYPKGIYVLDDTSVDVADWGFKRVSKYVGCVGPSAMLEADDEVYFVSPDGFIHALSAVQESGDVMSSAILPMQLGTYIRENVNFTRLARVASVYYAKKRKVMFAFSAPASSVNNRIIGLDIHRGAQDLAAGGHDYQPFVSTRDECQSLAIYRDPSSEQNQLLAGTSTGYVYQLDTEGRSKDGAGYSSRFETKDLDLYPGGLRNGNLRELEVTFVPVGNWSLDVDLYKDGDLGDPTTFTQVGTGGVLDSFLFDTDILGTDVLQNGRGRLYGDARRVRLAGHNDNPDESFSVAAMYVRFSPGNVR